MPPRYYPTLTHDLLIDLLCAASRRPARHCTSQNVLRTSQRCYATAPPPPPPPNPNREKTTQSAHPSTTKTIPPATSSPTKPSPPLPNSTAPAPGSPTPMRMLLDRNPTNRSAISLIPIPSGERHEKFVPQPLARPLGLPHPPQRGQNSPVDRRTLSEKRADFGSYEKALERRRVLFRQFLRPYFQEWRRVDHYKGKSFVSLLSNSKSSGAGGGGGGGVRLFKKDKALWFPNMWGQTLLKSGDGPDGGRDLVDVLRGKVSVVGIQSGIWAEEQVSTFLGSQPSQNPALATLLENNADLLQRVDVNVQGDWVRSLLVRIFRGRLRRSMPEKQWGRYFMVKLARDVGKGLTEDVRDAMGFLNSQVGYVYLLDTECRIRWAGSGHAWEGEVEGLNAGVRRLLEEAREGAGSIRSSSRKMVDGGRDKAQVQQVGVGKVSRPEEVDELPVAREVGAAVA